jgi:hypothetical protein
MNCFNNNRPKLSSSERTQNKKAREIFKANITDYQKRSKSLKGGPCNLQNCNNFNGKVGFYRDGTLRNVRSYDKFLSLNRGSALCVDGAYKGCGPLIDASENFVIQRGLDSCNRKGVTNTKVKIVTGMDSVYNRFSGLSFISSLSNGFRGFITSKIWCEPFINANNVGINQSKQPVFDSSNCVIVTDPSNNLFGSNFCPTDMDNISQGPNKYLAYTSATKYVRIEGPLWDASQNPTPGAQITCDDNTVSVGDLVISGLFSAANIDKSYDGILPSPNPLKLTKNDVLVASPSFQYFNGIGIVIKKCCGTGPNGEPNWWTFFVKILYGIIPPPQLLPVLTTYANTTDNAIKRLSFANNTQGVGGLQVKLGGQFKKGTLPSSGTVNDSPLPWAQWQKSYGNHPYGGGIGFFKQTEAGNIFQSTNIPIYATMGWAKTGATAWSSITTGSAISNNFTKKPLLITEGAGLPCRRNLMFGNNTEQNYLVSYDPANEKVRFNIDPKLYTDFNL